jgi:hypothetical protein
MPTVKTTVPLLNVAPSARSSHGCSMIVAPAIHHLKGAPRRSLSAYPHWWAPERGYAVGRCSNGSGTKTARSYRRSGKVRFHPRIRIDTICFGTETGCEPPALRGDGRGARRTYRCWTVRRKMRPPTGKASRSRGRAPHPAIVSPPIRELAPPSRPVLKEFHAWRARFHA